MPDLLAEMYDHRLLQAVFDSEKRRGEMKDPPSGHDYPDHVMAWYGDLLTEARASSLAERRRRSGTADAAADGASPS